MSGQAVNPTALWLYGHLGGYSHQKKTKQCRLLTPVPQLVSGVIAQ